MSGQDDSGSEQARRPRPAYEDVPTRPHRRPVLADHQRPTMRAAAIPSEATTEMTALDAESLGVKLGQPEVEATEMMSRDEILRRVKPDRREPEEHYGKPTMRMPALNKPMEAARPSAIDPQLRSTVESEAPHFHWVEFVCEVDRHGSLVLPMEIVESGAFRPGQRVVVRAHVIDEG